MARKASVESEAARVAFQKSIAKGLALTPVQLAAKFNLSPSTIYRAPWWKEQNKPQGENK